MKGVLGYRAEAFRMMGQLDKAIDDSSRALAMESDLRMLSDVYRTRAKAYLELDQEGWPTPISKGRRKSIPDTSFTDMYQDMPTWKI